MAWIIGANIVGAAVQLYGAYEAHEAGVEAAGLQEESLRLRRQALEEAKRASDEELQFARENKQQWESIFGNIQENLSNYYNSLDPDKYATMRITEFQRGIQEYEDEITKEFARRGLTGGGVEAGLLAEAKYKGAIGRAKIRATAEEEVAKQKSSFLELGLSRDPTSEISRSLAKRTTQAFGEVDYYGREASAYGEAASEAEATTLAGITGDAKSGFTAASEYEKKFGKEE